jgi:two-component system chemotaxis response regulator CheY
MRQEAIGSCRDDDQKHPPQQDRAILLPPGRDAALRRPFNESRRGADGAARRPYQINRLGWHGNFCHPTAMRVLIADDQKSVGTSLAELVRRCQHEVVEVVTSGLDAIHAYGRHHPDVVLMDYQMPKLNGATACRNIVAKYPDARVILVSGAPREIADSGALAVLLKPVKLDTLYGALYDAIKPRASA